MEFEENFQAAREVIGIFERISRAQFNLDKSTIMPMYDEKTPECFSRTGCKVARPDKIMVFLGFPIGVKILPSKEVEFLMDKVRNSVNH